MRLNSRFVQTAAAVLAVAACGLAAAQQTAKSSDTAAAAFDRFKSLAGDWTGAAGTVRFKVSSGGSVVEEIYFPDTSNEMINMITRDGSNVSLVHYCMIGNQPRMKAPDKATGNTVAFKYVSGGNMKSENDMHMHNVTFTFVDADTVKESWISYKDGKQTGSVEEFVHKRKK